MATRDWIWTPGPNWISKNREPEGWSGSETDEDDDDDEEDSRMRTTMTTTGTRDDG